MRGEHPRPSPQNLVLFAVCVSEQSGISPKSLDIFHMQECVLHLPQFYLILEDVEKPEQESYLRPTLYVERCVLPHILAITQAAYSDRSVLRRAHCIYSNKGRL